MIDDSSAELSRRGLVRADLGMVLLLDLMPRHRQGDHLGVGDPRGDPDRRAPRRTFGCSLQQTVDPDLQCGHEGVHVSAHHIRCAPRRAYLRNRSSRHDGYPVVGRHR